MLISSTILIPILIISTTATSLILKCEYKFSYWYDAEDDLYTCFVQNDEIFGNSRVTIELIQGTHRNGMANDNVEGVTIGDSFALHYFPGNIANFFKNLIGFEIYSSNLQEIHQNDLKLLPKLKYLYLKYNKLTIIDENLFKFNAELVAIYMSNNQISHIEPNAFDGLDNLSVLELNDNRCRFNQASTRLQVSNYINKIRNGECYSFAKIIEINKISMKNVNELRIEQRNIENKYENLMKEFQELQAQHKNLQNKLFESEKINENLKNELSTKIDKLSDNFTKLKHECEKSYNATFDFDIK